MAWTTHWFIPEQLQECVDCYKKQFPPSAPDGSWLAGWLARARDLNQKEWHAAEDKRISCLNTTELAVECAAVDSLWSVLRQVPVSSALISRLNITLDLYKRRLRLLNEL